MNILFTRNKYTKQEIMELTNLYNKLDEEDDRERMAHGYKNIANYTGPGAIGWVGAKGVRSVIYLDAEPIMEEPLDTMPLRINDDRVLTKALAIWRLSIGK